MSDLPSDGILTCHIAQSLTTGLIVGLDSSKSMIDSALKLKKDLDPSHSGYCNFYLLDARELYAKQKELSLPAFDKVFSNAALHWILGNPLYRDGVFKGVHSVLRDGGSFVFEMGGKGNVTEMRAAILEAVSKRVSAATAREADPWFFPDEEWMRVALERHGFVVEKVELEERPTRVEEGEGGGIEGWVRLMGSRFFDVVGREGSEVREECIREAVGRLERECRIDDGAHVIRYVRLRALARKPK
jgi:SAM-dependent methyltransferase